MLLAGGSTAALQAASLAIKQALPPICSGCLLTLQARAQSASQAASACLDTILHCASACISYASM